jgi:predicted ATP-dependent serine protease
MVLAVLRAPHQALKLYNREVFAATVGGIRLVEPAADLAMALAVGVRRRSTWRWPPTWWRSARSG